MLTSLLCKLLPLVQRGFARRTRPHDPALQLAGDIASVDLDLREPGRGLGELGVLALQKSLEGDF